MTIDLKIGSAPNKKCPPHHWVYKAQLEGRANKKTCSKCGKIKMHTHLSGFYGMGQHGDEEEWV